MKKDPVVYLLHIKDSIEILEEYVAGKNAGQFRVSLSLQDSAIRRLEIIGEAVKNLPAAFKKKYPRIPWRQVADMRNFLIHEYFGVDLKLVWRTIKVDLPKFKKQVAAVLKNNRQRVLN